LQSYDHIFTPLKIGRITVKNRIESSPAIPYLASTDHTVTRELIEWTRAIAKGGPGIVTLGDTSVTTEDATRHNHMRCLDLGTDKVVNGLAAITDVIHRYGAKASIEMNLRDPISPTDMTSEQIDRTIAAYAEAAVRCLNAEMDMILIHGGHGHLLPRFFSPGHNKRTDRYGGTVEKRMQFAVDVLEAIRNKVGNRLAIEYRISANEFAPGAPTVEETIAFTRRIENLIDLIHVSAGCLHGGDINSAAHMIQPLYVPRGVNVHYAEEFKKAVSIPVTAVGSITLDMAEEILASGKADMVAMIRTLIADRDSVEKARKGRGADIRPCIRCNTCLSSHVYELPNRCAVSAEAGRETEFPCRPTAVKKKVVVVGGGPGGMEAARTAAGRGHDVVLFEKQDRLGGMLTTATALPFKEDVKRYMDWAVRMTTATEGIRVFLGRSATADLIRSEKPDVLIVAVGAVPFVPPIPGIDKDNVVWAGDVDTGKKAVGNNILLVGAGLTGLETALHLAQSGKHVTIIDMLPLAETAPGTPHVNLGYMRYMLDKQGVEIKEKHRLEAITDKAALVRDEKGAQIEMVCGTVVLSLGVRPLPGLWETYGKLAPDVKFIGDCQREDGNLKHATSEGYMAAVDL
jgi:2,4-dienoyl-CoA reductase-like NADH-dependent reductase (Old Yellow Enzyme family)/NADPH-dependent 2,4-dienoyl-CoA reductase/sulfur reductase-like enzyme